MEKKNTKQSSKNKSRDKESVHILRNKVLTMDEEHLELKLAIKIRLSNLNMEESMFINKKSRWPSPKSPLMYQAQKRQFYKYSF